MSSHGKSYNPILEVDFCYQGKSYGTGKHLNTLTPQQVVKVYQVCSAYTAALIADFDLDALRCNTNRWYSNHLDKIIRASLLP